MSFQNRSQFSIQIDDIAFFDFLLENNAPRIVSLAFCGISVIQVPFLLYSIVWFDKYGSDKRRTFLNLLTSATCWVGIEYCFVIQATEMLRFIIGPFPKWYCFIKSILRGAYITQLLLYLDCMALTRYLFIFWLKNPAAFQSEFWITFFNIWSKGSSLIFNGIWCMLAEHQMVNYYVCSGVNPTEDFKKPLKQYASIEIASVIINLFVYARIKFFKLRDKNRHQITNQYLKKDNKIDVDQHSIASFATNLFILFGMCFLMYSVAKNNKIKPEEMQNYQTVLHIQHLVIPCVYYLIFAANYFSGNEPLRRLIFNEIGVLYSDFKENLSQY